MIFFLALHYHSFISMITIIISKSLDKHPCKIIVQGDTAEPRSVMQQF